MLRVSKLVLLCAGFLSGSEAARSLRRPSQSVAPQVLLSTDASTVRETQETSSISKVRNGLSRFFYPHFLQRMVSSKKAQESQAPPPEESAAEEAGGSSRYIIQLLFGLIYYFIIVRHYPDLDGKEPSEAAKDLQGRNEVSALFEISWKTCLLSCCCTGPRAAHTFAKTETMWYCPGLFLMTMFPCCTLMGVNSCTDMNEKVGGQRRNIVMSCLCALFCSCCVVAQDAEALDLTHGVETGFFGVYDKEPKAEAEEAPAETAKA